MVQLWQDQDPEQSAVDLVEEEHAPETGWKHVLQGQDDKGRMVTLVHEDSSALRRMAVFDLIVNNADRKGDHILAMADGHRYGVDHGLTFHREHKLRTVLWGWLGEALTAEELEGIDCVSEGLQGELGRDLAELLTDEEIASLAERCAALRSEARFPAPRRDARGSLAAVLKERRSLGAQSFGLTRGDAWGADSRRPTHVSELGEASLLSFC